MVDELHVGQGLVERRDVEWSSGSGTAARTSASTSWPIRAPSYFAANVSHGIVVRSGCGDEELVVVGPADLLRDDRQHVGEEVEGLGAREEPAIVWSSRKWGSGTRGACSR